MKQLEYCAIVGESPVIENITIWNCIPSRKGHVEPLLNLRVPPRKTKYYLITDSEPVPLGKGEKHPDEGSETVPDTGNLQAAEASLRGDGAPFV